MERVMNFGAGPAALPLPVLQRVAEEFLDFANTGKSILETSHRSAEYDRVHRETQERLKRILGLGDDYKVLFFGGGGHLQFDLVPMNLLGAGAVADYLVTGTWAKKAMKEAKLYGTVHVAADTVGEDGLYTRVPTTEMCAFSEHAAYLHLTSNNTIYGTQYHEFPETSAPLVADMSSDFCWRPFDAKRFGLIYAGAQKNLGPAGVTLVVIRQDLLDRCKAGLSPMMSYAQQAEKDSLLNTPPCFNIYVVNEVLGWIECEGGLSAMEQRNRQKGDLVYGAIDRHTGFYRGPVERASRSFMNVVFRLPDEVLEQRFVAEAKATGMIGLKGHRSAGGIRASLYNAVEVRWVEALVQFMDDFARRNG